MKEFVSTYGLTMIGSVLTAVFGWLGIKIKNLYQRYADTNEKQAVCKTVVNAIEQIYSDLNGEEKLSRAITAAKDMLDSRGITCTELELRMMLESAVLKLKGEEVTDSENTVV